MNYEFTMMDKANRYLGSAAYFIARAAVGAVSYLSTLGIQLVLIHSVFLG
jgi:hypothetical protein